MLSLGQRAKRSPNVQEVTVPQPSSSWHLRPAHSRLVRWGMLVVYAGILAVLADRLSLWGDEGYTAGTMNLSWRAMVHDFARIDVNMSVYYTIVHAFTSLLGTQQFVLRLPSVLSIVAAVPLVDRVARDLVGRRAGRAAALLLLANPFVVALAINARPYAMLLTGGLVLVILFRRALRTGSWGRWITWAVASGVLCYVHVMAAPIVGGILMFAWIFGDRRARIRSVAMLPILAVLAIPTVLFLAPKNTLNWVAALTAHTMIGQTLAGIGGKVYAPLIGVGVLLGLVQIVRERTHTDHWLPVVLLVTPMAFMGAVAPYQSLFVNEYMTPMIVPATILAGFGLTCGLAANGLRRWSAVAVAVLLSCGIAVSGYRLLTGSLTVGGDDWQTAGRELNADVRPGDAVAFPNAFYRIIAEYYAGQQGGPVWTSVATPVLPAAPWGSLRPSELDAIKRTGAEATAAALISQVVGHRSIWLVGADDGLMDQARATLADQGYRLTQEEDPNGILLLHLQHD